MYDMEVSGHIFLNMRRPYHIFGVYVNSMTLLGAFEPASSTQERMKNLHRIASPEESSCWDGGAGATGEPSRPQVSHAILLRTWRPKEWAIMPISETQITGQACSSGLSRPKAPSRHHVQTSQPTVCIAVGEP